MRYLTGGEPRAPGLVRDRDLPSILAVYDRWNGAFGLFAAYEKAGGAFVGWFRLRPELTGHGTRPSSATGSAGPPGAGLCDRGLPGPPREGVHRPRGPHRLGATMALNRASQKVMEKVGMSVTRDTPDTEDMLAVEGAELGGFRYEITREQWAHGRQVGSR